jgi:pimeloyl-ACP methyl ester carboxylesterase
MDAHLRTTDGADLFYDDCGSGDPLLLLHGFTGTRGDWAHVFDLDALARTYRVIAPDARGHGRSTGLSAFSIERCARDVLELIDHLGIGRARAVGMSLGAKTLLHVATRAPARIQSMILVSATPRLPDATRAFFRSAAEAPHAREEWDAMRALHAHGDDQIAALWRIPARWADDPADMSFPQERLATIAARTLVVAGDRDPLYPVELAVELYRGIPNAALWVVPGGGHGPIFHGERARFESRAREFLAE